MDRFQFDQFDKERVEELVGKNGLNFLELSIHFYKTYDPTHKKLPNRSKAKIFLTQNANSLRKIQEWLRRPIDDKQFILREIIMNHFRENPQHFEESLNSLEYLISIFEEEANNPDLGLPTGSLSARKNPGKRFKYWKDKEEYLAWRVTETAATFGIKPVKTQTGEFFELLEICFKAGGHEIENPINYLHDKWMFQIWQNTYSHRFEEDEKCD